MFREVLGLLDRGYEEEARREGKFFLFSETRFDVGDVDDGSLRGSAFSVGVSRDAVCTVRYEDFLEVTFPLYAWKSSPACVVEDLESKVDEEARSFGLDELVSQGPETPDVDFVVASNREKTGLLLHRRRRMERIQAERGVLGVLSFL